MTEPGGAEAPTSPSFLKRRFAKLPVWAWAVIVVAIIGIASSSSGGDSGSDDATGDSAVTTDAPPSTETAEETETADTETTSSAPTDSVATTIEETTTVPPTTEPEPELPGFTDGIQLIGVDVEPGIYVVIVPQSSFNCYWARLSDLSGGFDAIISNDNVDPGGQALVEISGDDEAFESNGCGRWSLYLPPATPAVEFGEGTWMVGEQIAPGRYRSSGPEADGNCYWARLKGLGGNFRDIAANDNQSGPTVVDISPSDRAFESSGCGTWAQV
jgi:hypothetical protein